MAPQQLVCRIRVEKTENNNADTAQPSESVVCALKECTDVETETRMQWVAEVRNLFDKSHESIRPWDMLARLDGSVESLSATTPASAGKVYPARFQIPPSCLRGLEDRKKIRRTQMFAMASLLYEIMTGTPPFEELSDDEVQRRFSNGDFPRDAASLPSSFYIYSGWSEEFSQELTRRVEKKDANTLQAVANYVKAHPVQTGIQVVGLTLSAASMFAVPILGAVGFTAAGPAAGSAAAAWQGSIGAIQAGSLFAWCQSAALTRVADVPGLIESFRSGFRIPQNGGNPRRIQ
ncbi:MAG: hypothetical protein Q9217_003722 [Psora testacea]